MFTAAVKSWATLPRSLVKCMSPNAYFSQSPNSKMATASGQYFNTAITNSIVQDGKILLNKVETDTDTSIVSQLRACVVTF